MQDPTDRSPARRLRPAVIAMRIALGVLPICLLSACGGGMTATDSGSGASPSGLPAASDDEDMRRQAQGLASIPTPTVPGVRGKKPPLIYNATTSARAGDVVSLQGENFGPATQVYLESDTATPLPIVNRVGTVWLSVQLPATALTGPRSALLLRMSNGTGTSARVVLNGAKPMHLDALQLVPGGRFRVFGRNLRLPGATPTVLVDGRAASVDTAASNEHMLSVVAPSGIAATAASVISVDNGNGSGAATLDRTIEVVASAGNDVFGLGVGWASAFAPIAARTVDAATDSRLNPRASCNGSTNDSNAIQAAIDLAATLGGAVVTLPAGQCRLASGLTLRSGVILQGAGKTATTLNYASNYPIFGVGLDRVGLRQLTLSNSGAEEGPLLKDSTRVVFQQVAVRLGNSRQMYLSGNRNVVFSGFDVKQTGSIAGQGPYTMYGSGGMVYEGGVTEWSGGASSFSRVHDAYVTGNRWTRDGNAQNDSNSGTVHSFVMDFAHRLAVVGNTFNVANGPIRNKSRNDGETLLTEGGASQRTENLGQVQRATATTVTDESNNFQMDPFGDGAVPENYGIAIVAGVGTGQTRRVLSNANGTLTVDRAWDAIPDATSRYATFVWGLESSLIKNNTLSQNPRGIWLYHTAVRNIDVVGNEISEGGGIYLRSYQNLAQKLFMPHFNVRIDANRLINTTREWMSYINSVFVNSDARAFGVAAIGIEIRNNTVQANAPNVESGSEEYAGTEGFVNMMRVENYAGYESMAVPRVMGTLITSNVCTLCGTAVRVGTGAGGTTILGMQLVNSPRLLDDWATTSTPERSTDTLIR